MPKRTSKKKTKKPNDINIFAKDIVDEATKESSKEDTRKKNPAAVTLGRLGGLKGGKARAIKLTSGQRKAIAKKAAQARWSKISKS